MTETTFEMPIDTIDRLQQLEDDVADLQTANARLIGDTNNLSLHIEHLKTEIDKLSQVAQIAVGTILGHLGDHEQLMPLETPKPQLIVEG